MRIPVLGVLRWGLMVLGVILVVGLVQHWSSDDQAGRRLAAGEMKQGLTPLEATLSSQVQALRAQAQQAAHLRSQLAEAERSLQAKTLQTAKLGQELADLRRQLAALASDQEAGRLAAARRRGRSKSFGPIIFGPGRVRPNAAAAAIMAQAARYAASLPRAKVMVSAHADPQPLSPHNRARFGDNLGLAMRRALFVARSLVARGVRREQIQVSALGWPPAKRGDSDTPEPEHSRWVIIKVSP